MLIQDNETTVLDNKSPNGEIVAYFSEQLANPNVLVTLPENVTTYFRKFIFTDKQKNTNLRLGYSLWDNDEKNRCAKLISHANTWKDKNAYPTTLEYGKGIVGKIISEIQQSPKKYQKNYVYVSHEYANDKNLATAELIRRKLGFESGIGFPIFIEGNLRAVFKLYCSSTLDSAIRETDRRLILEKNRLTHLVQLAHHRTLSSAYQFMSQNQSNREQQSDNRSQTDSIEVAEEKIRELVGARQVRFVQRFDQLHRNDTAKPSDFDTPNQHEIRLRVHAGEVRQDIGSLIVEKDPDGLHFSSFDISLLNTFGNFISQHYASLSFRHKYLDGIGSLLDRIDQPAELTVRKGVEIIQNCIDRLDEVIYVDTDSFDHVDILDDELFNVPKDRGNINTHTFDLNYGASSRKTSYGLFQLLLKPNDSLREEEVFLVEVLVKAISLILHSRMLVETVITISKEESRAEMATDIVHALDPNTTVLKMLADSVLEPINKIGNLSKLNKQSLDEIQDDALSSLDNLREAIRHQQNMLTRYRIAGTRGGNVVKVDVESVIQNVLDICSYRLEKKKINAKVTRNGATRKLLADETDLLLILWNIISNAIKFTKSSSSRKKLDINVDYSSHKLVVIKILDGGVGIPKENRSKVWQLRFSTAAPGEREPTTGLGLSTVSNIVKSIDDADVSFSSELNRGTEFTINLPYKCQRYEADNA